MLSTCKKETVKLKCLNSIFYSIVVNAITIRNTIQYVNATFLHVLEEQWSSTSWSWHSTVCLMDHTLAHSPGPYKDKEEKRYIHTQQHLKGHTKSIDWWDKRWLMRVCKRVDGSNPSPGYFLEKWQSALCPLSTLIINCCLEGTLSKR